MHRTAKPCNIMKYGILWNLINVKKSALRIFLRYSFFLGSNGDVVDDDELNGSLAGPDRDESDIVSNITEQLQAANPEDRVCGLQSLANLTARAAVRELVMRGRLVRIAGPLLLDADEMVRQAAAGALR
jgi:hypothetical protein